MNTGALRAYLNEYILITLIFITFPYLCNVYIKCISIISPPYCLPLSSSSCWFFSQLVLKLSCFFFFLMTYKLGEKVDTAKQQTGGLWTAGRGIFSSAGTSSWDPKTLNTYSLEHDNVVWLLDIKSYSFHIDVFRDLKTKEMHNDVFMHSGLCILKRV